MGRAANCKPRPKKSRNWPPARGGQARIYQCTAPSSPAWVAAPAGNGFTWHPTLGMPCPAAPSRLVRAVLELAYQGEDKPALLKRWFGTEAKGDVPEPAAPSSFWMRCPSRLATWCQK